MYAMALAFISSPPLFRARVNGAISALISVVMISLDRLLIFFSLPNLIPSSDNHLLFKNVRSRFYPVYSGIMLPYTSSSSSIYSREDKDLPSRQGLWVSEFQFWIAFPLSAAGVDHNRRTSFHGQAVPSLLRHLLPAYAGPIRRFDAEVSFCWHWKSWLWTWSL